MKKNIGFVITIILLIFVIIGLIVYIYFDQVHSNSGDNDNLETNSQVQQNKPTSYNKNNITIVNGDKCSTGCTEQITIEDGNTFTIYASSQELKINEATILKLEGVSSLNQVTVYDNIVIVMKQISLGCEFSIYDINGNLIKTFARFNDEQGRIFNIYSKYSQEEYIHVDENGKISFYGTKHMQGAANTYIDDSGTEIDLCTQGESIDENSIVSGIFEFSYLGDNQFSEIKYVSMKNSIKDIKACN